MVSYDEVAFLHIPFLQHWSLALKTVSLIHD